MKKLLIDAGNSGIKWALLDTSLDSGQLSKVQSSMYEGDSPTDKFSSILDAQFEKSNIDAVIIVSVLGDDYIGAVKEQSLKFKLKFTSIKSKSQLAGVTNAYKEPHKLGADRLVALVATHHLGQGQATIVIDSGTATTIDAVDDQGQHLGGLILPGLDLCSQSLLENTEQLALFNESRRNHEPNVFSNDTKQGIASGSLLGLVGAIEYICVKMEEDIQQKNQQQTKGSIIINKLICGGSADKLLPYLSNAFTYREDLIMQGLKIILEQEETLD